MNNSKDFYIHLNSKFQLIQNEERNNPAHLKVLPTVALVFRPTQSARSRSPDPCRFCRRRLLISGGQFSLELTQASYRP